MKAVMHLATDIKNTEKNMKNGEIKREKIIKETTKWIVTTSIGESGVVDMISAIVWFGIIILISAIMFVLYAVVSYDERKKKQEKEDGKGKKHSDDNGLSHSEGKADEG